MVQGDTHEGEHKDKDHDFRKNHFLCYRVFLIKKGIMSEDELSEIKQMEKSGKGIQEKDKLTRKTSEKRSKGMRGGKITKL